MPAAYAHFSFGNEVVDELKLECSLRYKEILEIINKNYNVFQIGLQGPDILFFYKPLSKNKVKNLGSKLHDENASEFFKQTVSMIKTLKKKEIALAYLLGVVCHFALDSECHSYIEHRIDKTGVIHTEIETAFEQSLLKLDGLDYNEYNTVNYIHYTKKQVDIIGNIFNLTGEIIEKSLDSMKFCNQCYLPGSFIKRALIKMIFKASGKYDYFNGLLVYKKHDISCDETNVNLYKLYCNSIVIAINLMENFYDYYNEKQELSNRFDRTYGPYEEYMKNYN